jgi:biopolymer transport protein ExbD
MWQGKEFYECKLEQENERLIDSLGIANKYVNKYHQTLQEIKAIAEADVHIVGDEKLYYDSIEEILQVITKAESEG